MNFIKYGNDTVRGQLSEQSRKECLSFLKRKKMLELLETDFKIPYEKGFAVYDKNISYIDQVINDCRGLIDNANLNMRKKSKPYLKVNFIDIGKLSLDDSIIKLSLDSDIISIISNYMGHVPILYNCSIWHSIKVFTEFNESQLFHCDWEDINNIKIFINLSDITTNDGPLTLIPADISQSIRDTINYTYGPGDAAYRVRDDIMEKYCSSDKYFVATGPKSTVTFIDTCRCFHYGSRVSNSLGKAREVLVIQYLSPAAINLRPDLKIKAPFSHLSSNSLTDLQNMVLGD